MQRRKTHRSEVFGNRVNLPLQFQRMGTVALLQFAHLSNKSAFGFFVTAKTGSMHDSINNPKASAAIGFKALENDHNSGFKTPRTQEGVSGKHRGDG